MPHHPRSFAPRLVSADEIVRVVSPSLAREAVRRSLLRAATGDARELPVVRDVLVPSEGRVFGIKSGHDLGAGLVGCKLGGYWPANAALGRPNHQSTVVLLDATTGVVRALVEAGALTALRTAAAAALAIEVLARPKSRVLGVIGAGYQAEFQVRAACEARAFDEILLWNRTPDRAGELARALRDLDRPVRCMDEPAALAAAADVLVTVTGSRAPLFPAAAVRPGTHLCCMGADTRGKREVDTELLHRARLYTDVVAQALELGECQHLTAEDSARRTIVGLGEVLLGRARGRTTEAEITLYDGTGTGLQDLVLAALALQALGHPVAGN